MSKHAGVTLESKDSKVYISDVCKAYICAHLRHLLRWTNNKAFVLLPLP